MGKVTTSRRGKVYQYRFELASVGGQRRWRSKSGFKTEEEAYAAGVKEMYLYLNGHNLEEPSSMSFADYLHKWLKTGARLRAKDSTLLTYSRMIEHNIIPILGDYKLSGITPERLTYLYMTVRDQGYSKSSLRNIVTICNVALKYAVHPLKYLRENPAIYAEVPRVAKPRRQRTPITIEEWETLMELFPFGDRVHVALNLGYHLGIRISEALGLLWSDVDLINDTVTISHQLGIKDGKRAQTPTKNNTVRTISFGKILHDILVRERQRQWANAEFLGDKYIQPEAGDLVCRDDSGRGISHNFITVCIAKAREHGVIFDFHTLRHTHATLMAATGTNMKVVQERLGHATADMTLEVYTHATRDMQKEAVDRFERLLVHK